MFDKNGYKLTDEAEDEIEDLVLNKEDVITNQAGNNIGNVSILNDSAKNNLKSSLPEEFNLNGLKIVMDCSNGATYKT